MRNHLFGALMRENVRAGAHRIRELVDEFDALEERRGDFLRICSDNSVEYVRESGDVVHRWDREDFALLRRVHELA
jgi:hypothetical protein